MKVFGENDFEELQRPKADSHKGQNGRVLVVGGSELFHSSIYWSADVASRWADLVHFTSPANENNRVVREKIKTGFWNGIVVDWGDVDLYIDEDDVVLIGPGMVRGSESGEKVVTKTIVDGLLKKFPEKRWVVDGGALQEVDPGLLNQNMIVTPHWGELKRLVENTRDGSLIADFQVLTNEQITEDQINKRGKFLSRLSDKLNGVTILSKAVVDVVVRGEEMVMIEGGNEGLTKGGTGDVLAGMAAAFYAKNEAVLAAAAASFVIKKAADRLYEGRGSFYNAADLIEAVGREMGFNKSLVE